MESPCDIEEELPLDRKK